MKKSSQAISTTVIATAIVYTRKSCAFNGIVHENGTSKLVNSSAIFFKQLLSGSHFDIQLISFAQLLKISDAPHYIIIILCHRLFYYITGIRNSTHEQYMRTGQFVSY